MDANFDFAGLGRRVFLWMAALLPIGAALFWWLEGARGTISFLIGGAASFALSGALYRVVALLDFSGAKGRGSGRSTTLLALSQVLVFAALYAILNAYEESPNALASGFGLTVAALMGDTLAGLLTRD
jgi:hypothetical protein